MLQRLMQRLRKSRTFQLLTSLKELFALISFYVLFIRAPFGPPGLDVSYHYDTIEQPVRSLLALDSLRSGGLLLDSVALRLESMVRSGSLLTITIRNLSSEPATNMELKVAPAMQVAEVGINSTSAAVMRAAPMLTTYECCDNYELSLPELKTLPARSTTTIQIWGDFGPTTLLYLDPVQLATSGRRPVVRASGYLSGFPLFVGTRLTEVMLFLGVCLLLLGIYRMRGRHGAAAASAATNASVHD